METQTLLQMTSKALVRRGGGVTLAVLGAAPQSGKTTVAFGIATALARQGLRVLAVDLDRTCALSNWILPRDHGESNLGMALFGATPVTETIIGVGLDNISIIPGSPMIARAEIEWLGDENALPRFRHHMEQASRGYDFTIIDCPPWFGRVVSAAIASADGFLVTYAPHQTTADGLSMAMQSIAQLWSMVAPHGALLGVVENGMTSLKSDPKERESILNQFGNRIFGTVLHRNTDLRVAMRRGEVLYSSTMFEKLSREMLGRLDLAAEAKPKPRETVRLPPIQSKAPPSIIPRQKEEPPDIDQSVAPADEVAPETWNPKIDHPLPETPPSGPAKAPKPNPDDGEDMFRLAARNLGLDCVDLSILDIDDELIAMIPAKLAKELKVFPIGKTGLGLRVVLANPFGSNVTTRLKEELGLAIFPCVAPNDDVQALIRKHYQ